jgi:hypothetical protein
VELGPALFSLAGDPAVNRHHPAGWPIQASISSRTQPSRSPSWDVPTAGDSAQIQRRATQAVFAAYPNTSRSTVQKWKQGQKKSNGPSLKRLDLVDTKRPGSSRLTTQELHRKPENGIRRCYPGQPVTFGKIERWAPEFGNIVTASPTDILKHR